ncbi:hypothetical protein JEOAER750_01120 [Jeotgalicoccus aerolatus]|jgi:hypothetical protein|uniref:Scaffold protein Nfu/NifU N terminal n=1 Tax=Jeotgalicoccus aerolatus TaxID=709510 RepID=A0A1G8V1F1_9STAP|nr:hypothetical protein [Jeotgalicoccus aerolatus]GGD94521.1 hypothetical protein GCM10007273_03560 [Jeotgalicoccus aerolatus]CAD2075066.1 hypothetical protein JEOAER750_01120 [Jeotgalicoccus aerolatus]SDJ59687.1 Scaffold protein Nfu/NifU N terminal [Jeotgalicoccus aerolatus]
MEIVRIEPTPSPNTMKITVNETKQDMKSSTYKEITEDTPAFIARVLELESVTSVFHALDFISVDKKAKVEWDDLIPEIEATFNKTDAGDTKKG